MSTDARIILRSLLAALCGAFSGVLLLAVPTYRSTESGFFFGEARDWAWLAAIVGAFLGFVPGALIGFLVTRFQTSKFIDAVLGVGVGFSLVILFFLFGNDPRYEEEMFNAALASIPIGGTVGLILSATNEKRAKQ